MRCSDADIRDRTIYRKQSYCTRPEVCYYSFSYLRESRLADKKLNFEPDLRRSTAMFGRLADPDGENNALSQVLYGLALRSEIPRTDSILFVRMPLFLISFSILFCME